MYHIFAIAGLLLLFTLLPGCQYSENYNLTENNIAENANVSNTTMSGQQDPALSRGGNTVQPETNIPLSPINFIELQDI